MAVKKPACIAIVLLLLSLTAIFLPVTANALEPVVLVNAKDEHRIGRYLEYLEDKSTKLTYEEVSSPAYEAKWKQSDSDVPSFGFTDSAYWVRFRIDNKGKEEQFILELHTCTTKYFDLYMLDNKGQINYKKSGHAIPFMEREIRNHSLALKVLLKSTESRIIYLRSQSPVGIEFPLVLYGNARYQEFIKSEYVLRAIIFGIFIILFLHNLILYIFSRNTAFLYLSLFILFLGLYRLAVNDLLYEYVWPSMPFWNSIAYQIFCFAMVVFLMQYSRQSLQIKIVAPKTNIIYNFYIYFSIIAVILPFINPRIAEYTIALASTCIFIPFITSIVLSLRGDINSKLYMLSFSPGVVGVIIQLGIIYLNIPIAVTIFMDIILVIVIFFMTVANAYNFNRSMQEIRESQGKIIFIQKQATEELEQKVEERTKELAEALDEVETINERLSESNTKLETRNAIIENEISLARKIQNALIPEKNPAPYIASFYKPMEEVGGDFYDFITFADSKKIGVFLSDVSGHGVPAAFITSMIKTILLQAGSRLGDPAALLLYMNGVLRGQTAGNFVTAFYGIYNPDTRSLLYSNAGHNQPYVINRDRVFQLQGGKNTAIAMFPNNILARANKNFSNHEDFLEPGSKLLLYTDGLVEARPVGGDMFFEYASMERVFSDNFSKSCDLFLADLMKELVVFRKSEYFDDDICLICMDIA